MHAQSDFDNVQVGPQDTDAVFKDFIAQFVVMSEGNDPHFTQVCNRYNAQGRLGYLGYG